MLQQKSTVIFNDISDNNSVQFFIIYVPNQQPQGQLQTQHSVDKSSYILVKHNITSGKTR
jgi:hypothetical protein